MQKIKMKKSSSINKITAWTAYPLVITLGFVLYYSLGVAGFSNQVSTYLAVIISSLLVTLLESKFPHRKEWMANKEDVKNDLLFMGFVQVILPKLLSFFFAVSILHWLISKNLTIEFIWPHSFPFYVQAIIMILVADFFRYWLHVLHHRWGFLWRFHSVHHSPHKLYWINVGRFHPIEETLQFLLDALPFILVGVSEQVLSLYFVFYSINGFFQHCNIELKLGYLNYIVSGPELHRWHHSMVLKESNKNYGNNLIVWDLLFGTWYLPEDKEVSELGLQNRNYPLDFLNQLKSPFTQSADEE